jgi:hypothetical protein
VDRRRLILKAMAENVELAELLDREAAAGQPDRALAALVDHGLYVPT